ncbi:MAG: fused MFS/spermidine synthase, partial [Pseudomonadota bacterium]|nr:fused MFS/spermidine synthase [Pseudomonadota bacterium]
LDGNNNILVSRNFFGVKRITENNLVRTLFHGTTQHGNQPVAAEHKLVKTGYYAAQGPYNDVFEALSRTTEGKHNVAVLGLGIGTLACFTQPQRHYDFYEIDVDVIEMAEDPNYFTYLSDCGSEYTNYLGDGRIEVGKQPDKNYKMIVADAFSSDNIPVHLITLDAARLYQEKLQDDGVLVFHISNRFLDLEPVMHTIGKALGLTTLKKYKDELTEIGDTKLASYPAQLVIMTNNEDYLTHVKSLGWNETNAPDDFKVWTDDYSNILSVLR